MGDEVAVRLLERDEAADFRALRLEGLKAEPASFFDDFEGASQKPLSEFEALFDGGWLAGGFMGGKLVAIAGMCRSAGAKVRHKGYIWGVYAQKHARGNGLGKKLIELLVQTAKDAGVELVQLSANEAHTGTVKLYKSLGFKPYGVEEHILKTPEGYVNDVLMVRFL